MSSATGLGKIIMVIICINVLLYVGGVRVIDNTGSASCNGNDVVCNTIGSVINDNGNGVDINDGAGGIGSSISSDFKASATATGDDSFVDNLVAVKDFITFLFNIIFTPLGLLTGAGMPSEVVILFGIPLLTIIVLGMAYFIRSGA